MEDNICPICRLFRVPDNFVAGRRLGVFKSDSLKNWFVGYSPRNSNHYDEGEWEEWVNLANQIIHFETLRGDKPMCHCYSAWQPID